MKALAKSKQSYNNLINKHFLTHRYVSHQCSIMLYLSTCVCDEAVTDNMRKLDMTPQTDL